ncbi:hypothetical protein KR044_005792 [Drosophila immigrans]|nr:hypothetical protein KR044_005792 [Drosophila immigrans]
MERAAADLDAVNNTSLKMCSIELQLNSSFRLQCSLSSLGSESDLSLAFDRDLAEPTDCDELPAFEIRAFSPHGRTPSPIDDLNVSDIEATPTATDEHQQQRSPGRQNNPEFVALHEINAQISAPNDNAGNESMTANSLETIFEGVFLHTPPRETLNKSGSSNSGNRSTPKRSRVNLMELVAMNRVTSGKENKSPSKERPNELT